LLNYLEVCIILIVQFDFNRIFYDIINQNKAFEFSIYFPSFWIAANEVEIGGVGDSL